MLKYLHVSAECTPFVKIGGLADVVGTLPGEIKKLRGADIRVFLPYYKAIPKKFKNKTEDVLNFTMNFSDEEACYVGVKQLKKGNILYYFIDNEFYFGSRNQVYGYGDESKRYAYYQLAVLEAVKHLDFIPDIFHLHDWHAAMIPLLLKTSYKHYPSKSVLTIHNIAYQGVYPLEDFSLFNIKYDSRLEFEGSMNYLKAGISAADKITTVSNTYASEILTDYFGYGMQNLLKVRQSDLVGILNGIDYKEFNPENDKLISYPYHIENAIEAKKLNKEALFKELKVDFDLEKPTIGIVSRLVSQKGIDLIKRVFDEMLMIDDFNFIVLGSGEFSYEEYFNSLQRKYPDKVSVYIGYSNKLAHMIYAGCDIFLMPSKFEPCGLGQIIALKYGTIPVVRETGGLVDTINSYNEYEKKGNGFSFTNFNAHDMMHVLRYAMHIYYHDPKSWEKLIYEAMSSDFSWAKSAKEYKKLYKEVLK